MSSLARAAAGWLAGSAAALAGLAALGSWPTLRLAGPEGVRAMGAACGIAAAGALAGAVPVLAAVAGRGAAQPHRVAGWAMALRSGATLAGTLVVALASELPRRPLALWVALAYGALLAVETRWTLRWLGAGARVAR